LRFPLILPGTIRGLHFQIEPFAEEKLVTCVLGSIFDVIVDLRPDSTTFGKWTSYELSVSNSIQLYLPKGVAHGFQTLTSNSVIQYCLSAPYSPENSFAINPIGDLGVKWPIGEFTLSERDASGLNFFQAEKVYFDSL
jgi:dTDP-4-dehydrorhamnose 3,5-epimerase